MLIFSADKFFKIPIYFIEKTNGLKYIKYAHHCFLFIIFTFSISVSFAESFNPGPTPPRIHEHQVSIQSSNSKELGSYLAASYALSQNDQSLASDYLMKAVLVNPKNESLLTQAIKVLVAAGRLPDALQLSENLIRLNEEAHSARLVLIVSMLSNMKEPNKAWKQTLQEQISLLRVNGVYELLIPLLNAWVEFGAGDPEAAIISMQSIANRKQYQPYTLFHSAMIYDLAGRSSEADNYYKSALANSSVRIDRLVAIYAGFLQRLSRFEEAEELYKSYKSSNPGLLWIDSAIQKLQNRQDPMASIKSLQDGLAEAFFGIGRLLPASQGSSTTLIFAQLALHLRSDFAPAQMLIAEVYESLQRPLDAFQAYKRVNNSSIYSWTARIRQAASLAELNRVDESADMLLKMIQQKKNSADAPATLGDIFRSAERYLEAIEAYNLAIFRTKIFRSFHWRLFYSRGVSLERTQDWSGAEADFLKALELSPDQPLVLNYLGYSWLEQGINLVRAKAMIKKAVSLRPNDGYIVDSLGWAFFLTGDFQSAVQHLERAVELMPDDPIINDHLGDVFWESGRRIEARFQWQRALILGADGEVKEEIGYKLKQDLNSDFQIRDNAL